MILYQAEIKTMYKDISFIIPSIRTFNQFGLQVSNKLKDVLSKTDYTYEILFYSKYKPLDDSIVWIEEKEIGVGPVIGYNKSFLESKGKYIYILNDKWLPNEKILKAIPFLESDKFKKRKFKVTSINVHSVNHNYELTDMPILNGCTTVQSKLPTELLHPRFLEPQHRYAIFGFPVFERDTVKKYLNNHLLNPRFQNHYHDNWLSFYIGEMGEFPLICNDTYMDILGGGSYHEDDTQDFNTFCDLAVNLIRGNNKNYV